MSHDANTPCMATIGRDIVLDTRSNPVLIASTGTAFVVATEDNVARMSKEIITLQNQLQAAQQKSTQEELEKKKLEERTKQLEAHATTAHEAKTTIQGELITLEFSLRQVYKDMLGIKQTVAPLVEAQAETRMKVAQLKEACIAIDQVLEWSNTYTQSPDTLPRRSWLSTQNDKAQMRIEI